MKSSETYKAVLELEPPSTERKQKPKTDIDPGEESIKVKTYDTEYGWHGQGEDGKRPLTEEEKFKQHVSMMGQHKNKIAQSHSFKRIMMDLLTEDLNI